MRAAVICAGVLLLIIIVFALLLLPIATLGAWQKKELEKGGV